MADVNGGAVEDVVQNFTNDPDPDEGLRVDGYSSTVPLAAQPRLIPIEED